MPPHKQVAWSEILGIDLSRDRLDMRICDKHFHPRDYEDKGKLHKDAVPLAGTINRQFENKIAPGEQVRTKRCIIPQCYGGTKQFVVPYHKRVAWSKILGIDISKGPMNMRLCEKHFHPGDYEAKGKLHKDVEPIAGTIHRQFENKTLPGKQARNRRCVVPKCYGGTKHFAIPHHKRVAWSKILDIDLSKGLIDMRVCENHFHPSDYEEKGRLHKDAVPIAKTIHKTFKNQESLENYETNNPRICKLISKVESIIGFK